MGRTAGDRTAGRLTVAGLVVAGLAGAAALAGCDEQRRMTTGAPVAGGYIARAQLRTADGRDAGRATASDVAGGLRLTVDARALPAGLHGAHVHVAGRCDAPRFDSAGAHWNPTQARHGTMNPQGPHQGDLPNLMIDTGGRGTVAAIVPGASVADLLDGDGASLVIHAEPDDLMSDPSGNSGGRIACGVFIQA